MHGTTAESATWGLVVADAGGGRLSWAAPRQLRNLSVERIAVAPLSQDTVAQIIRLLHQSRVQISDRIPRGLHPAVMLHMETHEHECITRACPQARAWMAEYAPQQTIDHATALPA